MSSQPQPSASAAKPENRRGDAVFVVLQTNSERAFTMSRMNEEAETLLGFEPGEMIGRRFEAILAPQMAELLADDIEFEDDAPDLGDILARHREIRLRHQSGTEIKVPCTISRLMSQGKSACFQLVIPNQREAMARHKIREFIALNLEGRKQLDEQLALPNHETAAEFLPLLQHYLSESGIEACVAVIRMDRYAKSLSRYGAAGCTVLLQHMANCCKATFRNEDIVFALTPQTLGVVLFDISRESSRLVLSRLRWNIRNHHIDFGGKSNFSVTTTILFDMLKPAAEKPLLEQLEAEAAAIDADERNGLIERGA